MKKRTIIAVLALMGILVGCTKSDDNPITVYKTNMETFFDNVSKINDSINGIDSSDESSAKMLLDNLDNLDSTFSQMATLEVPEGYEVLTTVATNASNDMSQAVKLYHAAYDGEYSAIDEENAYQYYVRANKELKIIIKVLHGDYTNKGTEDSNGDAEATSDEDKADINVEEVIDDASSTDDDSSSFDDSDWDNIDLDDVNIEDIEFE